MSPRAVRGTPARTANAAGPAVLAAETVSFELLAWICGCMTLALLAGIATLPVWVTATVGAAAAARLVLAARGGDAPPRAIRTAVSVVAIAFLFLRFRTFNGLSAGIALLSLIAGLKLLETRTRRDIYVISMIIYFLCLAALLQAESFWLLSYLIGVCWLTTATLLRLTGPSRAGGLARQRALRRPPPPARAAPRGGVLAVFSPLRRSAVAAAGQRRQRDLGLERSHESG